MNPSRIVKVGFAMVVFVFCLMPLLAGCSDERNPVIPGTSGGPAGGEAEGVARTQDGGTPPPNLVTVALGQESVTFWPYTGSSFDGTPVDPVNLIFAGEADPVQIRSALLALDGDRSAYGFPPGFFPFDQRWTDAIGGNVQTNYEVNAGWDGSVVQLTLGVYGPLRVHLRLFRTADPFAAGGIWTVGAAHFELQIPGTTEHQVLSWEWAQNVVMIDMIRSGLIDPNVIPSQPITEVPSWRTIPAVIFNQIPPELRGALGYPTGDIDYDFPIPNDGSASIMHVLNPATLISGATDQSARVDFGQLIPKPICAQGPYDYVYVTGPVDFTTHVDVSAPAQYRYTARYSGELQITPWDIVHNVPAGDPYTARVSGRQNGRTQGGDAFVLSEDTRLAHESGGAEIVISYLKAATHGLDTYHVMEHCLQPPTL